MSILPDGLTHGTVQEMTEKIEKIKVMLPKRVS